MSIKGIVESIKGIVEAARTLWSDFLSEVKKTCSWLYNREWSSVEVVAIVVVVMIVALIHYGLDRESKKKQGEQEESQKDKQDKKPRVLSGISKTEKEIRLKDLKKPHKDLWKP